jgi:hypothetical protein
MPPPARLDARLTDAEHVDDCRDTETRKFGRHLIDLGGGSRSQISPSTFVGMAAYRPSLGH